MIPSPPPTHASGVDDGGWRESYVEFEDACGVEDTTVAISAHASLQCGRCRLPPNLPRARHPPACQRQQGGSLDLDSDLAQQNSIWVGTISDKQNRVISAER